MGRKSPTPKAGPDLCAACEHERDYHNAAGCRIEQCGCQEFTRTASWRRMREERLETALRDLLAVIAADDLIPESVSYMRQAREALEGK
jgi:hypothetical protein